MSNKEDELGGRIPLLNPQTLNDSQRKLYNSLTTTTVPWANKFGFKADDPSGEMIGPFNPILYSPETALTFLAFQNAEEKYTSLSQTERQVVILTVGAAWKSAYELYAHSAVARAAGLSQTAIDALKSGREPSDLKAREDVAWRYTLRIVSKQRVERALYDEAQAAFGIEGLMDIAWLVGSYLCVCTILNGFDIPTP